MNKLKRILFVMTLVAFCTIAASATAIGNDILGQNVENALPNQIDSNQPDAPITMHAQNINGQSKECTTCDELKWCCWGFEEGGWVCKPEYCR